MYKIKQSAINTEYGIQLRKFIDQVNIDFRNYSLVMEKLEKQFSDDVHLAVRLNYEERRNEILGVSHNNGLLIKSPMLLDQIELDGKKFQPFNFDSKELNDIILNVDNLSVYYGNVMHHSIGTDHRFLENGDGIFFQVINPEIENFLFSSNGVCDNVKDYYEIVEYS